MLTAKDIILISSIEWGFLWQHAQEIASRLAQAGNRVLYVENTGIRSPGIKDAARVGQRLKSWSRSLPSHGVREVEPNVFVCSPLVLPPFGGRWRRQVNRRLLLPIVRRTARNLGMNDPILWTHLPTNTALELIKLLKAPRSIVVYYCIADFSQLTPYASALKQSEKELVQLSDLVFSNSKQLAEHCARWTNNVHVFTPGITMTHFAINQANNQPISKTTQEEQAREKTGPVVGYIGGLHRHVNVDMLSEMARKRPLWRWIFVGPIQTSLRDLPDLPNVTLIAQQPHNELIRYVKSFDVCIVPYLNNAETETVVPIKINEYLAAGKAVVSTDLPAVKEFNLKHNVLFVSPAEPQSFLSCIEHALRSADGIGVLEKRRAVAALSDWGPRIVAMSDLIEEKIARKR